MHEESRVYKNFFKETDPLSVWLDKCVQRLPFSDVQNLLTFLTFRADIAMSLILFYSHYETLEMCKDLSTRKQFQVGMKHFCPLMKAWSKRDLERYQYKNQDLRTKYNRLNIVTPYGETLSKNIPLTIWFLSDKLLESLIFAIKAIDYGIVGFDCCKIKHRNASKVQKKIESENFREEVINWLSNKNRTNMTCGELLLEFNFFYTPRIPNF